MNMDTSLMKIYLYCFRILFSYIVFAKHLAINCRPISNKKSTENIIKCGQLYGQ